MAGNGDDRQTAAWERAGAKLDLDDPTTQDLAQRLAAATGESLTEAVRIAIEERLARIEHHSRQGVEDLAARLDAIALHCASLPVHDDRRPDEIIGYDERGMW